MITTEQILLFRSLFHGRQDVYARYWEKGDKHGYSSDLPQLDTLLLAFPFSFSGKLIQYIGRIERLIVSRTIYDYRDLHIPYLEKMFKKRKTYYNKRGWMTSTIALIPVNTSV